MKKVFNAIGWIFTIILGLFLGLCDFVNKKK